MRKKYPLPSSCYCQLLLMLALLCSSPLGALAQLYPAPDCSQPQTYTATLGNPAQVTIINTNTTYGPGDYHVVGDLYFENCTVDIQQGAYFHVDGITGAAPRKPLQVIGYSLTLGNNVTVTATGAQFNASCNKSMWKGFAFDPTGKNQLLTLTQCHVGNARYGLNVPYGCVDATYFIEYCDFKQNLYHVVDNSYHYTPAASGYCTIKDSQFRSQPNLLPPYNSAAGLDTWTLEALHLTPTGNNDGRSKIQILGNNNIEGALYGIIANQPGQAPLGADNGSLQISRTLRVGIWLDIMMESITRFPLQVRIGMNNLIASRNYKSQYTAPAEQQYGLVATATGGFDWNYNLDVSGATPDTATYRCQTGVLLDEANSEMHRMSLRSLAYGLSLRWGNALIDNNTFNGCLHGLRIRPNAGSTSAFDISCNTFTAFGTNATSSGIYIEPQATIVDQGRIDYPVGNQFISYGTGIQAGTRSIVNNGSNNLFTYYRFSGSTDEEISAVNDLFGNQNGTVISTFPNQNPSSIPTDYCKNLRNVATGVQMRNGSRAVFMQALMDTLRRQAAPARRLERYQGAIRQWLLREEPDTAALDSYVRTLLITNPNAGLGLGLDLLEQYRRTSKPVAAALLRQVLAGPATQQPAARARLALSDILSRLKLKAGTRPLATIDSAALHRLALTPSGTANMAGLWYNYLYLREQTSIGSLRPAVAASDVRSTTTAVVRALYPNPVDEQLHVEVSGPAGTVVVRLYDLLSAKLVMQTSLLASTPGQWQADLKVRGVPSGQYAATVLVNDVPVSTQRLVINH